MAVKLTVSREKWLEDFSAQYELIKPVSGGAYNENRRKGSPAWQTAARHYGIDGWQDFLKFLGLKPYAGKSARRALTVTHTVYLDDKQVHEL